MANLNHLARRITLLEGKKRSVSIAQVKEVLRITLIELAALPRYEVTEMLERFRNKSV